MSGKAERLFRLVTLLRGRRLAVTAEALAGMLEVSPRTIYRDIAALAASGVPIEGEAGVGYRLPRHFDLPPVMFDREEVLALIVGGQMVQALTDPGLADAARRAEAKVRAILDDRAQARLDSQPYRFPLLDSDEALRETHARLRGACERREKLSLDYHDEAGQATRRTVWPLGMIGWTGVWTLLAWCELRQAYRNFRFDRIAALDETGEVFPVRGDRCFEHYIATLDCVNGD